MATVKVTVPDVWGDDKDQDGAITNWFAAEGDRVKQGAVIAEGMVEKVSFEITAPATGRLAKVLAPVDTAVRPGQAIAEIEAEQATEAR